MTTQTETKPGTKQLRPEHIAQLRRIADLYCLWRICGKPACRRGHACQGNARPCMPMLPLVSPEALLFLKAMDESRGWLSFDEMMEKHAEEWAAVEDWRELVKSTLPESDVWSEA